jgi:hypothetical protein
MVDAATLKQVEDKMMAELNQTPSQPYEALQYVQSFLARKKKGLGQMNTSTLVFHGATLLAKNNASSIAGTLLTWFVEDGAGVGYKFKLQSDKLNSSNYCDVQRLIDFLSTLDNVSAGPIVDQIFNPIHIIIAQKRVEKNSELAKRISNLEAQFAKICEASKKWLYAFKSYVRLGEMKKTSDILNQWSSEGYKTEKPLFFARGLLQLLSDNKIVHASELLKHSHAKIADDSSGVGGGPESSSLAVWHVAVIMTELAALPPMQRVDKVKLSGILVQRYTPLMLKIDTKLAELLMKAAEVSLGFSPPQEAQGPNPMAMLQGLLGGGGKAPGAVAPDMGKMMAMMNQMKSK